jgi:hypothetical protein
MGPSPIEGASLSSGSPGSGKTGSLGTTIGPSLRGVGALVGDEVTIIGTKTPSSIGEPSGIPSSIGEPSEIPPSIGKTSGPLPSIGKTSPSPAGV